MLATRTTEIPYIRLENEIFFDDDKKLVSTLTIGQ